MVPQVDQHSTRLLTPEDNRQLRDLRLHTSHLLCLLLRPRRVLWERRPSSSIPKMKQSLILSINFISIIISLAYRVQEKNRVFYKSRVADMGHILFCRFLFGHRLIESLGPCTGLAPCQILTCRRWVVGRNSIYTTDNLIYSYILAYDCSLTCVYKYLKWIALRNADHNIVAFIYKKINW